jgi:hypothetical protein
MVSMPALIELASGPNPLSSRLPSLLASARASRLSLLASGLESRHGGAGEAANQRNAFVLQTARKLAESGGDLSQLDAREKRAALEAFWRRDVWPAQAADVENWLQWAETEWRPRIAETRICAGLLRHFDAQDPVTAAFELWLSTRQDRLWGRFGDFARHWRVTDCARAAENAGRRLAANDLSFMHGVGRSVQTKATLQGSSFLVAVIAAYARLAAQRSDEQAWSAAEDLLDLLGPTGLAGAGGPLAARRETRKALVCGLVEWAARLATASAIRTALGLCFRVAGDLRRTMENWRDIPEEHVAHVEKWLVERTLSAAFEIVEVLGADDPAVLQKRKAFWLAYLPFVTRARLIGAQKAQRVAARFDSPCCELETGLSDHCGLLLELQGETGRSFRVVELNNLAQTMFWPHDHPNQPEFAQVAFDINVLRASSYGLYSQLPADTWPSRFGELIFSQTGISYPDSK